MTWVLLTAGLFRDRFPNDLTRSDEIRRRWQKKSGHERLNNSSQQFEFRTVIPICTDLAVVTNQWTWLYGSGIAV